MTTIQQIKSTVAHAFKLCMAKRSLEQLPVKTKLIECAILDIDEQLENLASSIGVTVPGIWDRFDATATATQAVLYHGIHRAASVARVH
jgi:hypothetical protein